MRWRGAVILVAVPPGTSPEGGGRSLDETEPTPATTFPPTTG